MQCRLVSLKKKKMRKNFVDFFVHHQRNNSLGDVEDAAAPRDVARGGHACLELYVSVGDPHRRANRAITIQLGLNVQWAVGCNTIQPEEDGAKKHIKYW